MYTLERDVLGLWMMRFYGYGAVYPGASEGYSYRGKIGF